MRVSCRESERRNLLWQRAITPNVHRIGARIGRMMPRELIVEVVVGRKRVFVVQRQLMLKNRACDDILAKW